MGIREEREKYRSQFVSVRHLLLGLAQQESVSIQEVATFILKGFDENTPPLFISKLRDIDYMREDFQYAFRVLNTVAFSDGIFGRGGKLDNWSNGLDHCGWFRVEMADFLWGIGIDSPDCCSESWRPEFESTEQKVVDEEHEIKNSTLLPHAAHEGPAAIGSSPCWWQRRRIGTGKCGSKPPRPSAPSRPTCPTS